MFENRPTLRAAVRRTAFVTLLIASSGTALLGGELALDTTWLTPNDTVRLGGEVAVHCFLVAVPRPGVLTIDAAVAVEAVSVPRLFLAGGEQAPSSLRVLERHADHLTVELVERGPRRFCVSAQDPRHTLHELKVRTAFAVFDDHAGQGLPTKEEDEGEIELEPGHLLAPPSPVFDVAELCELGEVDDHGDTLLCATPLGLGLTAEGELANGWGDDRDVFTFVVPPERGKRSMTEQRTVEIISVGADTHGRLLNEVGDRLVVDDGGAGVNAGFRLVKTLAPGRYFVLVEGARRAEGTYTLRMTAIDQPAG